MTDMLLLFHKGPMLLKKSGGGSGHGCCRKVFFSNIGPLCDGHGLGALQNLPGSIAWKLPTPGTGFGSGAGIIIHAVGVPGADWFWERQFHPRRRRVAGGRVGSGKNEGVALLRQDGTLEFVAEVMKVFRAYLHL